MKTEAIIGDVCAELRRAYGFEIKKDFHREACAMLAERAARLDDIERYGCAVGELRKSNMTLFDAMPAL